MNNETVQRLEQERKELSDKQGKLKAFIESDEFNTLSMPESAILLVQSDVMTMYYNVLSLGLLIDSNIKDINNSHLTGEDTSNNK
jgi:hypothetical protein